MAANFLGIFLLTLAGLSSVSSHYDVDEDGLRAKYFPWLSYYDKSRESPDILFEKYFRTLKLKNRQRYFDTHELINFGNIQETTSTDRFIYQTPPNVYSTSNIRSASDSHLTEQKVPGYTDSPEFIKAIPDIGAEHNTPLRYSPDSSSLLPDSTSDNFTKIEESESSFIDKKENRTDGLTFSNDSSVASYTPAPETKEKCLCEYLSTKIISIQDIFNRRNEIVQTESTALPKSSPVIRPDVTDLSDKPSFSDSTESTSNQNSDSTNEEDKKSTEFQNPSSVITTEDVPLGDKSSSSVRTETTFDKNSKLESTVTQSTSFLTSDENTSLKTKSTTEIPETEPTTENFISPSKYTSISFSKEVTEEGSKETFSTQSKVQSTTGSIKQDRVIEISSIHTARIVLTSVFLIIGLTALAVLAVYLFKLRRTGVEYDQLQLIP